MLKQAFMSGLKKMNCSNIVDNYKTQNCSLSPAGAITDRQSPTVGTKTFWSVGRVPSERLNLEMKDGCPQKDLTWK